MNKLFQACGLGILVLCVGCNQQPSFPANKPTVPVSGKVVFADGKPVMFAYVEFKPKDKEKGVKATGMTDQDGKFSLQTFSNKQSDGAVTGTYLIKVEPYDPMVGGIKIPEGKKPSAIPQKFQATATSGLSAEIAQETENLELKLDGTATGPSKKATVPVSGKAVFADGKPVQYAIITFVPNDKEKAAAASGYTDQDGKFALGQSPMKPEGAMVGSYRVKLKPAGQGSGVVPDGKKPSEIPKKLQEVATSEITVDIEGATDKLEIKLK